MENGLSVFANHFNTQHSSEFFYFRKESPILSDIPLNISLLRCFSSALDVFEIKSSAFVAWVCRSTVFLVPLA
ncbi:hypothetical protein POX_e07254 [Penicillium oxalicum]|uniref:Uncharacterized protein n=1 Tax=Penicillium oxalicum (strain 114-2 / CGMCC 5302) TaxID=933388 RepID=S8AQN7_PENO1|nr:hypothetical protein POX_e07254 [Penicillium oxalicum]EPS28283.1 hypothetical protein PDE_03229 [Penicillium oxalicum 114-2]KAI2789224.1 hypothetical protein POX_e07254 [Penicillium oxalicum]